jgi:hypothetical protein
MRRRDLKMLIGGAALVLTVTAVVWIAWPSGAPRSCGPFPSEAYVWQRHWGPEVSAAVTRGAKRLSGLVALAAEVSFEGGHRRVARAQVDPSLLASSGTCASLALRIGACPGPFGPEDEITLFLSGLARDLVAEARQAGLTPGELQLDFDCAASRLRGYLVWVEAIRKATAPTPVAVTVLPSWMGHEGFRELVEASPRYVLQVHSLGLPQSPDGSLELCHREATLRWVEQAARYGVPFRVALPTYGYTVGFRLDGKFVGVRAEAGGAAWPEGTMLREVRAGSATMAGLVSGWTEDRPAALEGIIWYRLPVDGDRLNWSWTAFSAVLEGRAPRAEWKIEARRVEPCLYEVVLRNDGEEDWLSASAVSVRWSGARLLAGEAFGGVEWIDKSAGEVVLQIADQAVGQRVSPGEDRTIGWLRMSSEVKIDVDLLAKNS